MKTPPFFLRWLLLLYIISHYIRFRGTGLLEAEARSPRLTHPVRFLLLFPFMERKIPRKHRKKERFSSLLTLANPICAQRGPKVASVVFKRNFKTIRLGKKRERLVKKKWRCEGKITVVCYFAFPINFF